MNSVYTFLIFIVVQLLYLLKPILPKKIQRILELRKSDSFVVRKKIQNPVWIHCSSGEFEYAKPVIRELKSKNISVVVTYFSPSVIKNIESTSEVDAFGPSPWDLPGEIQNFVNRFKPRCLLISRTDVWWNMVSICKENQIPSLLFSATIGEKSSRKYPLINVFTKRALNSLSEIYCVSKDDKDIFEILGVQVPIQIQGDTRYDQVIYRLKNGRKLNLQLKESLIAKKTSDELIFIAGSTWFQDEEILLPVIEKLKNEQIKWILVPHEVDNEHISSVIEKFKGFNLTYLKYSDDRAWIDEKVLLVDKVGVLADLYEYANLAFIGGSFKYQVHSVMEALACGLVTFVGPYHTNNREALMFQKIEVSDQLKAVTVFKNSDELQESVKSVLKEKTLLKKANEKINEEFNGLLNKSQFVVEWVLKH